MAANEDIWVKTTINHKPHGYYEYAPAAHLLVQIGWFQIFLFKFHFTDDFRVWLLKYSARWKKMPNEYCQPQTSSNLHYERQNPASGCKFRYKNTLQRRTMYAVIFATAHEQINLNKLFTDSQIHTLSSVQRDISVDFNGRSHLINLLCTFSLSLWAHKIFLADAFRLMLMKSGPRVIHEPFKTLTRHFFRCNLPHFFRNRFFSAATWKRILFVLRSNFLSAHNKQSLIVWFIAKLNGKVQCRMKRKENKRKD